MHEKERKNASSSINVTTLLVYTLAPSHLCPVDGVVVLGASLGVGVVHQRQVSQHRAPLGVGLLPGSLPQQPHRHVGCVVVLKGDFLDLKSEHHDTTTLSLC